MYNAFKLHLMLLTMTGSNSDYFVRKKFSRL